MSATLTKATEPEKPVANADDVKFPPFPDPTDDDFDEDLSHEEKAHYKSKFPDLNLIVSQRLHCTACDRHLGCSGLNDSRMKLHPMLRTLICNTCHSFYNSGEFDKGEDGSELYCRWCGQGGQVYCCSDCVHVFCAKCIKRNLGIPKIKEIENTDDWKCFKCNSKCIWDLRAACWALLRYCDLRNKLVHDTEDVQLRQKYAKAITIDQTECCKRNRKSLSKNEANKKKEKVADTENVAKNIISKMPPTIQVKKFASVNMEDLKPKVEKKAQKRPASPKNKPVLIKTPIAIAPYPPMNKKIRIPPPSMYSPIRFGPEKKMANVARLPRPRIIGNSFNNFSNPAAFNPMNNINMNMSLPCDNINLSLDSLTQGLDFAAVQAMSNQTPEFENNDNVVCTPDFPLEPLCEVTEDNDDDVECITPAPVTTPISSNPPPLAHVGRTNPAVNLPKGVIQMSDSDVTVNVVTGGLKFRVDPQTLSANKMYRLPDGRIFAINPNPNMPGGYSATIVSQNSDGTPKVTPRSETFAAKLSAVSSSPKPTRIRHHTEKRKPATKAKPKRSAPNMTIRESDVTIPVEWFRYNIIDAVDALEYSLTRLQKLKKETPTAYLRSRTVDEMKYLHRSLEQLLTTSAKRFIEIRETLNKEMKLFLSNKNKDINSTEEEEDDDVEILPNHDDDPIFIDENSVDDECGESNDIDLTGAASSEHNDSTENRSKDDSMLPEALQNDVNINENSNNSANIDSGNPELETNKDNGDAASAKEQLLQNHDENEKMDTDETLNTSTNSCEVVSDTNSTTINGDEVVTDGEDNAEKKQDNKVVETMKRTDQKENTKASEKILNENGEDEDDNQASNVVEEKEVAEEKADQNSEKYPEHDTEMSEEMIETLLKDDNVDNNASMEISDLQEAESILS